MVYGSIFKKQNRIAMVSVILALVFLTGCASTRPLQVLVESERYYFIPAGTPFSAVVIDGQPPQEVIRSQDSWVVDAGYLVKLQESANMNVLGLDDNQ